MRFVRREHEDAGSRPRPRSAYSAAEPVSPEVGAEEYSGVFDFL
jgi:hypothetical protein